MKLRISSTHSVIWAVTQAFFAVSWVICAAALLAIFLGALLGVGGVASSDLGMVAILLVFGLPVAIFFARVFARDARHHLQRHAILGDDALYIRDPVWLNGTHRIGFEHIDRVMAHEGGHSRAQMREERILDLSFRAPARHKVHVVFSRPLNFRLRETPLIFHVFFSFLDPGSGEARYGVLLESRNAEEFLSACARSAISTAAAAQPDTSQAEVTVIAPASANS